MNKRELQAALGATVDGFWGPKSTTALLTAVFEGRVVVVQRVAAPVATPVAVSAPSAY